MMKMIEWLKAQPLSTKAMILMIVLSIVGIVLRWDSVRKGLSESVVERIENTFGTDE